MPRYRPYSVSGGSIPTSASVSSSAQSSTTTAMFAILSLNRLGRRRSAFSTSDSNWRRVTIGGPARLRALVPSHALDVDDVPDLADGLDDVLELADVGDLDDEVVDAAAIVGHGHLGLRDVAVSRRDGAGDLREEPRPVLADVDRDANRALAGLGYVPLDVDQPFPIEHALGDGETVARVYREPAAPGDEAHDRIARQRIAAARKSHQQVVNPADPHAVGRRRPRLVRLRPLRRLEERVGRQLVQHLVDRALAVADRRQQVVGSREAEVGRDLPELVAGQERRRVQVVLPRLALEQLAAELDRARTLLDLEPLVDPRARPRGLDDLQPVPARVLVRRRHDLDDVALPQRVAERDELGVHLRADAVLADLGVHRVGEVERRRALREGLDVALGREHVDLVREEVDPDGVHEFPRVLRVLLRLDQLTQPHQRLVELVLARLALLVEPVGGDSLLGDAVHLARTDLDLHRIALGADHRRVERLVHVHLRHRDEVLEAARDGLPQGMDDAESAVAVARRGRDGADGREIVDLVELPALVVHLLPDRVEVLGASADLGIDADLGELALHDRNDLVDVGLALETALGDALLEIQVVARVEAAEGEILELRLHLGHAEPVGQGRVDVERLLRDLPGTVGRQVLEGAHVVETIGELDHEHAQVARHRHQHLPEILGLALLARREGELADLRDAVDELGDLAAELALEIGLGGGRVLQDVVEEAGRHGSDVHLEIDEEGGDLERVAEVRLTGGALLTLMRGGGELVGARQDVEISARLIFRNRLDQRL